MEEYGVEINAVFFRVFDDDGRRYLTRAWLREPAALSAGSPVPFYCTAWGARGMEW